MRVDDVLDMLDYILQSKTKRHIVGGALLSVSFLFGGLALTAMTIKEEDSNEQKQFKQENIRRTHSASYETGRGYEEKEVPEW